MEQSGSDAAVAALDRVRLRSAILQMAGLESVRRTRERGWLAVLSLSLPAASLMAAVSSFAFLREHMGKWTPLWLAGGAIVVLVLVLRRWAQLANVFVDLEIWAHEAPRASLYLDDDGWYESTHLRLEKLARHRGRRWTPGWFPDDSAGSLFWYLVPDWGPLAKFKRRLRKTRNYRAYTSLDLNKGFDLAWLQSALENSRMSFLDQELRERLVANDDPSQARKDDLG